MLYESVGHEILPRDKSLPGAEVVASGVSPSGVTGPKLAPRIGEVGDAGTLNEGMIGTGSERGDDSAGLPAWLADAVRRWDEWPEWKQAAVRALVEANDAVR